MKEHFFYKALLIPVIAASILSCSKNKSPELQPDNKITPEPPSSTPSGTLLFQSDFEAGNASNTDYPMVLNLSAQRDDLAGSTSGKTLSDWRYNLETGNPYFGDTYLNYEQGDYSQRRAEIVADPTNAANKVLRFRISDKHIFLSSGEVKARIQMELRNTGTPPSGGFMKEYYQKCRLYFSSDFSVLENAGTDNIGWFVMQEFWNDPSWTYSGQQTHSEARTDVEIVRRNGKLRFGAKGRDPVMEVPAIGNNSWEVINTNFAIPLGKWITQEIYVKEGGSAGTANPGRFYLAVTVDGVKTVLVDKTGMTTSETTGYIPDGQTSWNPMKVYTEGKVIDWFKNQGKTMDIYWDDLEIWKDKKP